MLFVSSRAEALDSPISRVRMSGPFTVITAPNFNVPNHKAVELVFIQLSILHTPSSSSHDSSSTVIDPAELMVDFMLPQLNASISFGSLLTSLNTQLVRRHRTTH